MSNQTPELPIEILDDAGSLISQLTADGWMVIEARYDPWIMGNWHIDLTRDVLSLRLIRDRSQFFVSGPPIEELKTAGLWCAFDDFSKFQRAVLTWAAGRPQV